MHYCEYVIGFFARLRPCDEPACIKIKGQWYCDQHGDVIDARDYVKGLSVTTAIDNVGTFWTPVDTNE